MQDSKARGSAFSDATIRPPLIDRGTMSPYWGNPSFLSFGAITARQ